MSTLYLAIAFLFIVALGLIHYKPIAPVAEGFAVTAVNPAVMPDCVARSTDAQSLLARFASVPVENDTAAEMRLLVAKLCCLEADIATPAAGVYRTQSLQFRTSHDMEPASTFVGRCQRNAIQQRDIDLVVEKFEKRGHELLDKLLGSCPDGHSEFASVVARTRLSMVQFCLRPQPSMDHPTGARDVGFWEPERVADLSQYQGITATPKTPGYGPY